MVYSGDSEYDSDRQSDESEMRPPSARHIWTNLKPSLFTQGMPNTTRTGNPISPKCVHPRRATSGLIWGPYDLLMGFLIRLGQVIRLVRNASTLSAPHLDESEALIIYSWES